MIERETGNGLAGGTRLSGAACAQYGGMDGKETYRELALVFMCRIQSLPPPKLFKDCAKNAHHYRPET